MRLPNGFGSVYKLSGQRRRPWIARKTTGWTPEGKQEYYTIGYYKTRTEAISALTEYNKNPIGDRKDITLKELYDEWSKSKYPKLGAKTVATYETAWIHFGALQDVRVVDIKTSHLQAIIDDMHEKKKLGKSSCQKVKVLAGILCKKAMADDIINKNYAEAIELHDEETQEREFFSDLEIKKIEALAKTDPWAKAILIMIYTGLRIGELLSLTKFSIDMENQIITGGIKTEAGKNRVVPINPKILGCVKHWYETEGSFLINRDGKAITVNYFRKYLYYPTLEKAKVRRLTPHSTRHTFASLLNRAGANTKAIQKLIGHADYSTTANIYTHTDIEELRKAITSI